MNLCSRIFSKPAVNPSVYLFSEETEVGQIVVQIEFEEQNEVTLEKLMCTRYISDCIELSSDPFTCGQIDGVIWAGKASVEGLRFAANLPSTNEQIATYISNDRPFDDEDDNIDVIPSTVAVDNISYLANFFQAKQNLPCFAKYDEPDMILSRIRCSGRMPNFLFREYEDGFMDSVRRQSHILDSLIAMRMKAHME